MDEERDTAAAAPPTADPVRDGLDILAGAFARKGELDEIAFWYPEVAARIRALEARAAAAGVPCRWGHAPPAGKRTVQPPIVGLCWSCGAKKAGEDDG